MQASRTLGRLFCTMILLIAGCGGTSAEPARAPSPEPQNERLSRPATTTLAAGGGRFCARGDEQVACWGRGDRGQLDGQPHRSERGPFVVPGLPQLSELTVARDFTCGLTPTNEAWCWGLLPEPTWTAAPVPVLPPGVRLSSPTSRRRR